MTSKLKAATASDVPADRRGPAIEPALVSVSLTHAGYICVDIEGADLPDQVRPTVRPRPLDAMITRMLLGEVSLPTEIDLGALKQLEARLADGLRDVRLVIRRLETSDWWRPYTGGEARARLGKAAPLL